MPTLLSAEDVEREAVLHGGAAACEHRAVFASRGWESFPSTASEKQLTLLGTLWNPEDTEPTLEELHRLGSSFWSPDAPIALRFHPCNRCELCQCSSCSKPYLRYTEYGGYDEEKRIRELRLGLIDLQPPGPAPKS